MVGVLVEARHACVTLRRVCPAQTEGSLHHSQRQTRIETSPLNRRHTQSVRHWLYIFLGLLCKSFFLCFDANRWGFVLPLFGYKARRSKPYKEPRNRFPAWQNRFLVSWNVSKYGLRTNVVAEVLNKFEGRLVGKVGKVGKVDKVGKVGIGKV